MYWNNKMTIKFTEMADSQSIELHSVSNKIDIILPIDRKIQGPNPKLGGNLIIKLYLYWVIDQ